MNRRLYRFSAGFGQYKAVGRVLFEQVCRVINLLEVDYFGLEYADSTGTKYWLDYEKPMCRQMGLSMVAPVMDFCVKFYTPDPAQLEEEFTRYLFSLQIKRDLSLGILQCSDPTAALLASYIVQASCGDYVPEDYPDHSYLSTYKFVPHQNKELEIKIMDNHKKHVGQSPAESDLNLLETARRCELYGIRMTAAKDNDGLPLNLSVAHMGVIVFQNTTKINTFSWAKIRKLSFKRRKFLIKLHPEGYEVLSHTCRDILAGVPFFASADPGFTNDIAAKLKAEFYQPKDVIVRQGGTGTKVFFVRSGTVAQVEGRAVLGTCTRGSYFGEACLLGPTVRKRNVVAETHCCVFSLLETDFHAVLRRYPVLQAAFKAVSSQQPRPSPTPDDDTSEISPGLGGQSQDEPIQAEPAEVDPLQAGSVQTEPAETEPLHVESFQAKPSQAQPIQAELSQPETSPNGPPRTKRAKTKQHSHRHRRHHTRKVNISDPQNDTKDRVSDVREDDRKVTF
ncbi:hypothetical protein ISCGN_016597 [Ixodes scapularis]